jgi:hypothetical protein
MVDYTAGDLGDVERVNAAEVTAAEAIDRVFHAHLVGADKVRAWKILWLLASKRGTGLGAQSRHEGSIRDVAKKVGLDPKRVRVIREHQLRAIADGVRDLLPEPEYRTGIILRAAELARGWGRQFHRIRRKIKK